MDIESLAELNRQQPDPSGRGRLQGRSGERLLYRILETGRCYLGEAQTLLQAGEPKACVMHWRIDRQGMQHPLFECSPSAMCVFRLQGLWYVDAETGECGRLEPGPPVELLEELFALSEGLAPDAVPAFNRMLSERFPDSGLPAPRRLPIVDHKASRPVPCLRLTTRVLEI